MTAPRSSLLQARAFAAHAVPTVVDVFELLCLAAFLIGLALAAGAWS